MLPANVSVEHTIGKRFRISVSFGIQVSESDVTHGIFRKQALEFPRVMSPMGFSVSFGISESDVTHGIFRMQALEFSRVMSSMGFSVSFGSRAPLLLKTKTKENANSDSTPITKNGDNYSPLKKKCNVIFIEHII